MMIIPSKSYVNCLCFGEELSPVKFCLVFFVPRVAAYLRDRGINPKTIKQYINGIRSYQVDRGASKAELDIFHHPQLERIVAGIRRLRPAVQPRER